MAKIDNICDYTKCPYYKKTKKKIKTKEKTK